MFMRHTKKCLQLLEGTTGSQQLKSHQLIKEKVHMDDQESSVPAAGKDTSKDCTSQTTPINHIPLLPHLKNSSYLLHL